MMPSRPSPRTLHQLPAAVYWQTLLTTWALPRRKSNDFRLAFNSWLGNLSKAAKELVSSGLHPNSPSVMAKLRDLHPQSPLPPLRDASALPRFVCEAKEVRTAIRTFPVATAPGPSGLRVDHLRECLTAPSAVSEPLLESVTRFLNKALNGELPVPFAEFFLCARLLPFRKKMTVFAQSLWAKCFADWVLRLRSIRYYPIFSRNFLLCNLA